MSVCLSAPCDCGGLLPVTSAPVAMPSSFVICVAVACPVCAAVAARQGGAEGCEYCVAAMLISISSPTASSLIASVILLPSTKLRRGRVPMFAPLFFRTITTSSFQRIFFHVIVCVFFGLNCRTWWW